MYKSLSGALVTGLLLSSASHATLGTQVTSYGAETALVPRTLLGSLEAESPKLGQAMAIADNGMMIYEGIRAGSSLTTLESITYGVNIIDLNTGEKQLLASESTTVTTSQITTQGVCISPNGQYAAYSFGMRNQTDFVNQIYAVDLSQSPLTPVLIKEVTDPDTTTLFPIANCISNNGSMVYSSLQGAIGNQVQQVLFRPGFNAPEQVLATYQTPNDFNSPSLTTTSAATVTLNSGDFAQLFPVSNLQISEDGQTISMAATAYVSDAQDIGSDVNDRRSILAVMRAGTTNYYDVFNGLDFRLHALNNLFIWNMMSRDGNTALLTAPEFDSDYTVTRFDLQNGQVLSTFTLPGNPFNNFGVPISSLDRTGLNATLTQHFSESELASLPSSITTQFQTGNRQADPVENGRLLKNAILNTSTLSQTDLLDITDGDRLEIFAANTTTSPNGQYTAYSLLRGTESCLLSTANPDLADAQPDRVLLVSGLYEAPCSTESGLYVLNNGGNSTNATTLTVIPESTEVNSSSTASLETQLELNAVDLFAIEVQCTTSSDSLSLSAANSAGFFPAPPQSLEVNSTRLNQNRFELATTLSSHLDSNGDFVPAPAPLTQLGNYATLTYSIAPVSELVNIDCTALSSDAQGNSATVSVTNATVRLDNGINSLPGEGQTISGTVIIPPGVAPEDVVVTLIVGDVTLSTGVDAEGNFSFTDIANNDININVNAPASTAQCQMITVAGEAVMTGSIQLYRGDINTRNGDGEINIADATIITSRFGLVAPPEGFSGAALRADINKDGVINIQDLAIIASALGTAACQ